MDMDDEIPIREWGSRIGDDPSDQTLLYVPRCRC